MTKRISSESGIAIGVILFAIAIMAAVAIAMSAGNNSTSQTINIDRVGADVKLQGMLILSKIRECHSIWADDERSYCDNGALSVGGANSRTGDPYPPSQYYYDCNGINYDTGFYPGDKGPLAPSAAFTPILVSSILCPAFEPSVAVDTASARKNLWTGSYPANLPLKPGGLDEWYYVDAASTGGGRCIYIKPYASTVNDTDLKNGLALAAQGFTSTEMVYSPGGTSQRFVLWVTPPTGTPDSNCQSP